MKKDKVRQAVIKQILGTYGSVDDLDVRCLAVRFKVDAAVVTEDIARVSEAQKHAAELERERANELAVARRILKGGSF